MELSSCFWGGVCGPSVTCWAGTTSLPSTWQQDVAFPEGRAMSACGAELLAKGDAEPRSLGGNRALMLLQRCCRRRDSSRPAEDALGYGGKEKHQERE